MARQKHNYTSELELKSLLIRIKNSKLKDFDQIHNSKINKYIIWHTKIKDKNYVYPKKRNITKAKLKEKIIQLSEITNVDKVSYEKFGEIILLMIKNILRSPKFSGYTYRDDFYSDAVHKILKYLHNFDHTLISERSGTAVNSFAYISQIIHNSILYIINKKKKEQTNIKKQISMEKLDHNYNLKQDNTNESTLYDLKTEKIEKIVLKTIKTTLLEEIELINTDEFDKIEVIYPSYYVISFDEYDKLKPLLKGKLCITRQR